MPSDAGVTSSSRGSASIRACAASVWSMARSIVARKASRPNVSIASQTLIARLARVSCSPRSAKFTPLPLPLLEVLGVQLERALEQPPFAHEQAADLERHREPLVRIERDRVGLVDPRHRALAALRQDRECPVGTVDVEPDAALVAGLGELADRIDCPGVRRARVRADEERQPIRVEVGVDRRDDVARAQPEGVIGRQDAELVGPEPQVARRPGDGRVRLIAGVHHDPRRHRADERLPGAGDRGEVRGRSAGHQDARRRVRVPHPVAEPVQDRQLEGARSGGFAPRAGIDHGRGRDQVTEGGGPGAGTGDVAEEARMVEMADERQDVLVQDAEQLAEVLWAARRSCGQALAHRIERVGLEHRSVAQRLRSWR